MSEQKSTKDTPQIDPDVAALFEIVNEFNYKLKNWMLDTGCGAEIRWNYNPQLAAEIRLVASMDVARVEKVLYSTRPDDDAIREMIAVERMKYDQALAREEALEPK